MNGIKDYGLVSVIIPTYNREKTIVDSVLSVLNQSYRNIECIVVDDCSTDATEEKIRSIHDKRLSYYKLEENKGANHARNVGMQKAVGKYIAFQDSDDIWRKNKLKIQLDEINSKDYDFCFCRFVCKGKLFLKIFPRITFSSNNISLENILSDNFAGTPTMLFRRKTDNELYFDEKLPRFQDWDFMIQMVMKSKICFVNKILVDVSMSENSITLNPKKGVEACDYLIEKYEKLYNNNQKSYAGVVSRKATYEYQLGNKVYAIELFKKSCSLNPSNKKNTIKMILARTGLLDLSYKKMGFKGAYINDKKNTL